MGLYHKSRLLCLCVLFFLFGISPGAWAGPAEEVAELARQRSQAFNEGNVDAFMSAFVDNAVFTSSRVAFRIEGKEAIRAYFVRLFQSYPTRVSVPRQISSRVYANGTVAVVNSYNDQTWVDRNGQATNAAVRISTTWLNIGGRWMTVDQHVSKVPVSP